MEFDDLLSMVARARRLGARGKNVPKLVVLLDQFDRGEIELDEVMDFVHKVMPYPKGSGIHGQR